MFATAGQSASAADMPPPLRRAPPPEMVVIPYDWTGIYIGAHAGLGMNRSKWADPTPSDCASIIPTDVFDQTAVDGVNCSRPSDLGSHSGIGFMGGGQVGFNIQSGPVVIGLEASYSYADIRGDHDNSYSYTSYYDGGPTGDGHADGDINEKLSSHIKGIATATGRIGLTSFPSERALFYVLGGGAYMRQDVTSSINAAYSATDSDNDIGVTDGFSGPYGNFNSTTKASINRWGWVAGAGVEFGLFDGLSAKIEYNYIDFGTTDVTLAGTAVRDGTAGMCTGSCAPSGNYSNVRSISTQIHAIKFGLNYRFGGYGY
jgi:outer membrane immunogenic protein